MSTPINFPEVNNTWKGWPADDKKPEIKDLPVHYYNDRKFNITVSVSCWKVSFWEKVKILFSGKVWLCVYGQLPPISITGHKPQMKGRKNE